MKIISTVLILLYCINGINSTDLEFKLATWNTFDVYYGNSRDARRDYFFSNREALFGDLDVFCTQESHSYASIADFKSNFGDIFPYSYHFNDPSSSYQACLQSEIADFEDETSEIYLCNEECTKKLPATLSYIFCLWRCFGELKDNTTGITTRDNNIDLFDFGKTLELSPCLVCLWKSNYVESFASIWDENNATTDAMFDDILDVCVDTANTFDYKVNEGMILWSKHEFDSVSYVDLSDAVFIPRGYIIATISDETVIADNPLSIICTHLETPTIDGYFQGNFATMIQQNIDDQVSELSDITQIDVNQLIADINNIEGNVILMGDLNIGINSRVDIYDELLSQTGLKSVFGTNDELIADVECTRCDTNQFTSNNEIVDHILIKGDVYNDVSSSERFLDSLYNTTDGSIPLSDHYGIKATFSISVPSNTGTNVPSSTDVGVDDNSNIVQYIISSIFVAAICVFWI